ncbi:MAG: C4-dicarboxylic acid transporter DauA [Phycisphaerae bacterium]|nr:C4-dicarboxylic acid transporter DauA [Phycisphaerae bacterium]
MRSLPELAPWPASALREALREGYTARSLRADVLAGLVVGVVALPLSMALAIASGVQPQHGLYTAIVAGFVIAALGGSRVQVSGPTAAFVVILAPITSRFGLEGLMLATMMAGGILILMGLFRLGRLIEFIPHPVTTGFTAGIAVVIATLQVRDFLGLRVETMPEHFVEKAAALWRALPTTRWSDAGIGLFTLALLLVLPRLTRRIPAPLLALPLAAAVAAALARWWPELEVSTIRNRFGSAAMPSGIPSAAPRPILPWLVQDGAHGRLVLDFATFQALFTSALAIAMLGAIESLLSAVVADGMTGRKHNPDSELLAQGVGNVAAPFFGGFAATGALARTATNIRSGAVSPVASMVHAVTVLGTVVALAPALGRLPMASMAALLLVVARNMADMKHFAFVLRRAPRSDSVVLLTCFVLTVVFDMVVAVGVGVVLAAALFIERMRAEAASRLVAEPHPDVARRLPRGVLLYEIAGPLFFGAASRAMAALRTVSSGVDAVVLDMRSVPFIDATGMVNLESAVDRLHAMRVFVILGGLREQPFEALSRAGWVEHDAKLALRRSMDQAIDLACLISDQPSAGAGPAA